MQISVSAKFWLIFAVIVIAAFLGGILGNWVFIYLLDKYYGIPGGNYLAAPTSSEVIVRDAKKTITEQDNKITQAVLNVDAGIARIFKKTNGTYLPQDAVATALVVTSDGWLITPSKLTAGKTGYDDYEAATADRKRFAIEKVYVDPVLNISFIHLKQAQNLIVRNFIFKKELSLGQTIIGLANDQSIEVGRLSRGKVTPRLSDASPRDLTVTGFSYQPVYLFDASGQIIGLNQGRQYIAMDTIDQALEKLLTDGKVTYPRLGVRYVRLSEAYGKPTDAGALLIGLDKNNPAVVPGTPADKAGLKAGDIITAIDEVAVNEFNDLSSLIEDYNPQETISITLRRGTETKKISVKLDEAVSK